MIPWLEPSCERLRAARVQQRFAHALLIHDAPGAGGSWLAGYAAQVALCELAAQAPCGSCRGCLQFQAGTHPDYRFVTLEEDEKKGTAKQIKVDQIRELIDELVLTSHGNGASVAVIDPAEAMHPSAANALLKTLEEPRAGVSLILVSSAPSRLPATIRSRCQRLNVPRPTRAAALAWLRAERGAGEWEAVLDVLGAAPLAAAALDPAEVVRVRRECWDVLQALRTGNPPLIPPLAERWGKSPELSLRLACLENWLTLLLDAQSGAPGAAAKLPTGGHLPAGAWVINMRSLFQHLDRVREIRRLQNTPVNMGLALEQMLWQWRRDETRPADKTGSVKI